MIVSADSNCDGKVCFDVCVGQSFNQLLHIRESNHLLLLYSVHA
jgi:hypothetical protein